MRTAAFCLKLLLVTAAGLVFCGCAAPRFTTLVIYETPHAFVRLETDPTVTPGGGHSHPAHIPTEIMAAALAGIVIEDPVTRLPLYDDLSQPRRRPALTDEEIGRLAPLLSLALGKATPEEVVTFYESARRAGGKREVTSGGLFVAGDELRVVLSNVRADTGHAADIGVADTEDDRLTPMRPVAPQRGRVSFEPAASARDTAPQGFRRLFHWDRRELAILYRTLAPRSLDSAAISAPAVPRADREPR